MLLSRRDLAVPTALAAAQVLVWPAIPLLAGARIPAHELVFAAVAIPLVVAALVARRIAPLPTLGAVLVVLAVIRVALPDEELLVVSFADLIALFSIAVHRPARVASVAAVAAFALWTVVELVVQGPGLAWIGTLVLVATMYALTWAFGRAWRRWRAGRDAVAARLARADADRQYAAAAERDRLAAELHDVTAHHLSSIVIHAQAAERVADHEPAAVREALELSEATGLRTLESLRQLLDVIDAPPDGGLSVGELVAGFERLGMPVTLEDDTAAARPAPAEVCATVYRIAQEALTNALRYAGGAPVRVWIRRGGGAVDVRVEDEGRVGAAAGPATALGSGSGLAGMRRRVADLGGDLTAGPSPTGWSVHARLPLDGAGTVPDHQSTAAAVPWWSRVHSNSGSVLDAMLAVVTFAFPALAGILAASDPGVPDVYADTLLGGLLVLVLFAHSAPLLWRRRAPWLALSAVSGVFGVWSVLGAADVLEETLWLQVVAIPVELIAVYSVGAYRRPPRLTWLAALVAGGAAAAGGAAQSRPGEKLVGAVVTGGFVVLVALGAWAAGVIVRVRRLRTVDREGAALRAVAEDASAAAHAERERIAVGLRGAVSGHTERLVAAARQGLVEPDQARERLGEVRDHAQAGLGGMRELLGVLRGPATAPATPAPTIAGAVELCRRRRAGGQPVTVTVQGTPRPVPAEVELSVFELVAALLAESGDAPAEVRLAFGRGELLVVLAGTGPAGRGPVLDTVRDRVDAVGGAVTLREADGGRAAVHAWFPVPMEVLASGQAIPGPSA